MLTLKEANLYLSKTFYRYLSKDEDECSQAMKQFFKGAIESGASYYEQTKSVAHSYTSKQECSVQEAVYHIMQELWLRKIFQEVVKGKSKIPEKCLRMMVLKGQYQKCVKTV